ncbi:MAG: mechanosensitive ion channel family protein [Myxococcota bacterium]
MKARWTGRKHGSRILGTITFLYCTGLCGTNLPGLHHVAQAWAQTGPTKPDEAMDDPAIQTGKDVDAHKKLDGHLLDAPDKSFDPTTPQSRTSEPLKDPHDTTPSAASQGADTEAAAAVTYMDRGRLHGMMPRGERCLTPRAAVEQLLRWTRKGHQDLQRAALCLDVSQLPDVSQAGQRARQLKEVLDARGLLINIAAVANTTDFRDGDGEAQYTLFSQEPEITLEKRGRYWLWSAHTVAQTPNWHAETFVFDVQGITQNLPPWMRSEYFGLRGWQTLALLVLIGLAVLVRAGVRGLTTNQGQRLIGRLSTPDGKSIFVQVGNPLGTLAAMGAVAALLPVLQLPVRLNHFGLLAARIIAVVSAVVAVYRLTHVFTAWLQKRAADTETKLDDQLVPLIESALKIFTVAIGVIFILQNLDIDVGGVLAGLGLGGLAFALAAKDTVANLFGSATIFASRPFQIGDWVYIDKAEGTVESVGFRSTRIRTFYNSLISVPNAKVADSVIDNYGARSFRRVRTLVGLTYDTSPKKMQAFVEGIRAIIKANPFTRKDIYEVHFYEFGASSLNILVYFFFKCDSWSEELRQRHNIFLEIVRLAKDVGVEFAFPTQTLHIDSMPRQNPHNQPPQLTSLDLRAIVESYGPDGNRARTAAPKITEDGFLAG